MKPNRYLHPLSSWLLRLAVPFVFGLVCLGSGRPASAQESTNAPRTYASENEDRVRTAINEGVEFLRRIARDDETGFCVPPIRTKRILEWKEADVHYAEKLYDIPIYESYKTMETVETGDSTASGSRKIQEVTKIRVNHYEQKKTLIPDANGKVIIKTKYPVYGPGGPDYLYPGFFGQNGVAVYAMLQAGVQPEDEQFAKTWRQLLNYVDAYGMPDRTWDLAWVTIAAVNLPRETPAHQKLVQNLVNKLLLGQIPEGPSAGMWGPICVNTKLLIKMVTYEQDVYKRDVASWEKRVKEKPDDRHLKDKVEEAKYNLKKFQVQYPDVTTLGLKFHDAVNGMNVTPDMDVQARVGWGFTEATLGGWPFSLVKERTADMECTALVLFALQEAARNRLLPELTTVPVTLEKQPVVPAEKSSFIIQRALESLIRLETNPKIKPFTEANFWQPVHDFDVLGLTDLPVNDKDFPDLDSPVTMYSVPRTYAALLRAGLLAGPAAPAETLLPLLATNRKLVLSLADQHLKGITNTPPMNTVVSPYDYIYETQPVYTEPGDPQEVNRTVWLGLADELLHGQEKDGSWKGRPIPQWPWYFYYEGYRYEEYETSLLPRIIQLAKRYFDTEQMKLPKDKRQSYNPGVPGWRDKPFYYYHSSLYFRPEAMATAYSILSLAQGIRTPLIGIWAWDGKTPRANMVRTVINGLSKDRKVPLTYRVLPAELPLSSFHNVPVIYISGSGPFAPAKPESLDNLKVHLENQGAVVIETTADAAGQTFITQCQAKLHELAPAAKSGALPALVKGVSVQGMLMDTNRVVAAFYLVTQANQPAAGTVNWSQAAQFTYKLVAQAADPRALTTAFPVDWSTVEQAEQKEAEEKAAKAAAEAAKAAGAAASTNQPAKEASDKK